ncbi:N-acetylmuramate alpha-1-phosphate uridylyltransferase MurU [Candidatus Albibeggiatoa sp. nov. BB20]|uniref:N-acetylmuramate alpha-1-phosphate uridylyltransferase MurU n=1 Tax=Candidatus Albibeggiatoa sp. nov. BB20 TaxID=3162723 RepID=UPI0033656DD2
MKVMLLAAGRGERMRPLTDTMPKPLLPIAGKSLIEHQLNKLVAAGFSDIVINHAYLGEQIVQKLGDGSAYGATIVYSAEPRILGTAGGIVNALPLLGSEPFLVVNSDVWTNFPFQTLNKPLKTLAHLVLVPNPEHHPTGDFHLQKGIVSRELEPKLTFSGIGVYHPEFFCLPINEAIFGLAPLLIKAMSMQQVTGESFSGTWVDVGTPKRLESINHL